MATQRTKKTAKKSVSRAKKLRRPKAASRRHRGGGFDLASFGVTKKTKPIYLAVAAAVVVVTVGIFVHGGKSTAPFKVADTTETKKLPLVEQKFIQVSGQPLPSRLAQWSEMMMNEKQASVVKSHLMKSEGMPTIEDNAPLFPEKFNCTTFVETVVALSRSTTDREFFKHLIEIRYKNGATTYLTRNHFPEADWIPNNSNAGVLSDQTVKVATHMGVKSEVVSKEINRGAWLSHEVKAGHVDRTIASKADGAWTKTTQVGLPFVPVAEVKKHADRIPSGVIANIVRANNAKQPVLITHQGFVFQENGTTVFRHSTPHGDVRTVNFAKYLESIEGKSPKDWKVVGVNFNQVHE